MSQNKCCRQCGKVKGIDGFRKYTNERGNAVTCCKECESINNRRKYLERKDKAGSIAPIELAELGKIYRLYKAQRERGLKPPLTLRLQRELGMAVEAARVTTIETLDALLQQYAQPTVSEPVSTNASADVVPEELTKWLSCPLTEDPDYYINEVYEDLQRTYRPATYMDKSTMRMQYDDTYSEVLSKILERFYAYEDAYYK